MTTAHLRLRRERRARLSRRGLLGRAAAAGAAAALTGLVGEGLSTRYAFAAARLHRRHAGRAVAARRLRRAVGDRAARRRRLLPGPADDRRAEGQLIAGDAHVRPAPGAGAAAAAVAGRQAGRRARGRPAQPDPLALRRDGGDGAGGGRHVGAHRLAGPDARAVRRDQPAGPGCRSAAPCRPGRSPARRPTWRWPRSTGSRWPARRADAADGRRAAGAVRRRARGAGRARRWPPTTRCRHRRWPRAARTRRPTARSTRTPPLGAALRDVARLVKAKVGLRRPCVDFGDWDMHEGLGTRSRASGCTTTSRELSLALAAFADRPRRRRLAKVTLVTLSEFGRRVAENGSQGADHGHGNAMLLLGGGVRGGKVYGDVARPGARRRSSRGDLAATTDYRAVIGEVLQKRCGRRQPGGGVPRRRAGVVRDGGGPH